MEWIVGVTVALLVFSIAWLVIEYKREQQREKAIFDEYFKRKRKLKFKR